MEVDNNLRKLQLIELDMLKEVVRICKKHNLTYYLSAGTFLGAVRHHGFIPWDDDVDIRMPRPDYEKLFTVIEKELSAPYKFEHFSKNKNVHRYFGRIIDPRVVLHRSQSKSGEDCSAWLDIFPLDGMPNNILLNKIHQFRLLYRRMWLQISVFDEIITLDKKRSALENLIIWIVRHTSIQKIVNYDKQWYKLDKVMKSCPVEKSKYLVNFIGAYKFKDMIPKTVYGHGAEYQFEDSTFNGPEDYDAFLKHLYNDYMKLPPENMRNKHFTEIMEIRVNE